MSLEKRFGQTMGHAGVAVSGKQKINIRLLNSCGKTREFCTLTLWYTHSDPFRKNLLIQKGGIARLKMTKTFSKLFSDHVY